MKCPKCGFTSFDHLDNCKKCGNDLLNFKARHGVRSLLLAGLTGLTGPGVDEAAVGEGEENSGRNATDFGFDWPAEETVEDPVTTAPAPTQPLPTGEKQDFPAAPAPDELVLAENSEEMELGQAAEVSLDPPAPEEFSGPGDATDADALDFGSADDELPPLDLESIPSIAGQVFDSSSPEEDEVFLDWGELDLEEDGEVAPENRKKSPGQEDPPDPFDSRGFTAAGEPPPLPDLPLPNTGGAADQAMDRLIASFDDFAETTTGEDTGPSPDPPPDIFLPPGDALAADLPAVRCDPTPAVALPHDSPEEPVEFEPDSGDGEDQAAPLVHRLAASLADLLILAAVFLLFLALGQWLLHPDDSGSLLPPPGSLLRLSTPYFLVLFSVSFGYFTFFHFLLGQTPGKMLFGLAVEGVRGEPLTFAQAFLRSAGGLASLCLAGVGYAMALFDAEGRGWNDRLAGSRVVLCGQEDEAGAAGEETG